MRIISKYKDFYDYVVSKYGFDSTVTYDRTTLSLYKYESHISYMESNVDCYQLHVANNLYSFFEYKGQLYHTEEELQRLAIKTEKNRFIDFGDVATITFGNYWWETKSLYKRYNGPSKLNKKFRIPVLYFQRENAYLPYLKSFGFHKALSADETYKQIYEFQSWLKDNPPIPNKQTDEEKLLSHGFDKKISFRHRK